MTTTTAEDDDLKEFTRRRLAACPTFRSFMPAGRCRGISSLAGPVRVASRPCPFPARSSPLPVIGAFARAMGGTAEGGYVELKVDVSYRSRPEWLEGDYDSWIAAWD